MQENKFKEATGFYEPIVRKNFDNILNVSAIVLANLCVSYIMTSQNEEAEELMRKIEKEEEQLAYEDPEKKVFHLCIVNLVIGTLYCAKGTIPILCKHFIAQRLIPNFSKKLDFFVKTKEFLFQHYILTKFSCCSLTFLVHKEEKIKKCSKNS